MRKTINAVLVSGLLLLAGCGGEKVESAAGSSSGSGSDAKAATAPGEIKNCKQLVAAFGDASKELATTVLPSLNKLSASTDPSKLAELQKQAADLQSQGTATMTKFTELASKAGDMKCSKADEDNAQKAFCEPLEKVAAETELAKQFKANLETICK